MIDETSYLPEKVTDDEWTHDKCDKYDYIIAASCGALAGVVDVFFVGDPQSSILGSKIDKASDHFVVKAAQFFWKNDKRQQRQKKRPETLIESIRYMENTFPVNYDARYAKDLATDNADQLSGMWSGNHHVKSLAHDPSIVGLIFSIIDQMKGYASFVDKGRIIHVYPANPKEHIPYLQGSNLPSMIFCGFVNWIGHLISDLAGSSTTRLKNPENRGSGIPMPFYTLLLTMDFGDFDGDSFADVMTKVFENGYDFRFGIAASIPVAITDLMVRAIWLIRRKFMHHVPWKDCVPNSKHADLRIMLLIGNTTLCIIDGADAAVRGIMEGNVITFVMHLNLVAWARLIVLALKEISIHLSPKAAAAMQRFYQNMMASLEKHERELLQAYYVRMKQLDEGLSQMLSELKASVDREYAIFVRDADAVFAVERLPHERANSSILLAKHAGVSDTKIIHDDDELDKFFGV